MSPKTAPKENLSRLAERKWHGRASWHGATVPKFWRTPTTDLQNRPSGTVVPRGTATPCHVAAGSGWSRLRGLPCRVCSILRDFHVTLLRSFFRPPWHSFLLNVVQLSVSLIKFLKNIERC